MQSKLRRRGGVSLPEDVLFEVLLRLPTKSLRRFRCVCKLWLSLITDPAFMAARRSRASPFMAAVFECTPSEHELRLLGTDGDVLRVFDVKGSTALLAPTRLDLVFVERGRLGVTVIDPASGRGFTVDLDPPSPLGVVSFNDYSFGRASPSGAYKVLHLHATQNSLYRTRGCEVATIMEGDDHGAEPRTWRQRPWGPFEQSIFMWEHKATVDGDLYFLLVDNYSVSHGGNRIAVFNLESEEWKAEMIRGPLFGRKNREDKWRVTLTELKGALCMVHNVCHLIGLGDHYVNIWLLKDPNRSVWVKEYKIQMSRRSLALCTKPLDVLPDGKLLLLIELRKPGNNKNCRWYALQFYNSNTKAFTDFMKMAEGFDGRIAFYTGSLQS